MKRWYVIQIIAGYEKAIKADILKRVKDENLEEKIGDVLVPSAKAKRLFDLSEKAEDHQLFPGYMLVEMEAAPETVRLITTTPRVSRFLGGREPIPLSAKEVERMLAQISGEVVIAAEKHAFEVGSEVEIKEGPFTGFIGIIETVQEEHEKLTVMVSIFGRMTPVELTFDQVKH